MSRDDAPRAAKGSFPYPHRTVAEADRQARRDLIAGIASRRFRRCPRCNAGRDTGCEHRRREAA